MTIQEEYKMYQKKYELEYGEKTIPLMQVGSFWEIYGISDDFNKMKNISELLNVVMTKKNKNIIDVSINNPYLIGFPLFAQDKFIPILINQDYTLVFIEQVTEPPNPKREVTKILSKGLYENSPELSNNLVCIYNDNSNYGAASIDVNLGNVSIYETSSSEDLYKYLKFINPCELVLIGAPINIDFNVKTYNIGYTFDKNITKIFFQQHILENCYMNNTMLNIFEFLDVEKLVFAIVPFIFLINWCKKHSTIFIEKLQKPKLYENKNYLNLSYNCAEQLNLNLIEKMLNKCSTSLGKRFFKNRLRMPLYDSKLINESYNKIEELISKGKEHLINLRNILSNIYDLQKLFRKVIIKTARFNDLQNIYKSLQQVIKILPNNIILLSHFQKYMNEEKWISDLLIQKQNTINSIDDELNEYPLELNKKLNVDFFKFIENGTINISNKRYSTYKTKFDELSYRIVSTTGTITKLSCNKMDQLISDKERLLIEKSEIESKILNEFLETCLNFTELFEKCCNEVSEFDFITNGAYIAIEFIYSKPRISNNTKQTLIAKEIRHPFVEINRDDHNYIKNDFEFDKAGVLLFGINSSGKSTLMKALGVNIILAQSGLYTACDLEYTLYDAIFTRIAKSDDITNNKSSFIVEMSELRNILQKATKYSLVLGDEIASTSENISALSIVSAGIDKLNRIGCNYLFSSHLHELLDKKLVDLDKVKILHLSVEYDKALKLLIYNRKLLDGPGSKLYGIEVIRYLNFDEDFIDICDKIRTNILNDIKPKSSKYNRKVIGSKCQICESHDSPGEFHHLNYQKNADESGIIHAEKIKKNRTSNIIYVCTKCHDNIHTNNIEIKTLDTTSGKKYVFNPKK